MIAVTCTDVPLDAVNADVLVVGAYHDDGTYRLSPAAAAVDDLSGGALATFLDAVGYEGRPGQVRSLPGGGAVPSALVLVVGVGAADAVDIEVLRRAGATVAKAAAKQSVVATTLVELFEDTAAATQATVEGMQLTAYRFLSHKSDPKPSALTEIVIVGGDADGAARGLALARAGICARELATMPAGDLPPRVLAERAEQVAADAGLTCEIWDEMRIADERCGGIVAVARGSAEPPRFITLTYDPPDGVEPLGTLVLVGKGVTFDSGGLSLKTADGMEAMKTDMSGGAAVIAALGAVGELRPPVRVVGMVPATENMPNGRATKPGDVFAARNGTTVEVLNTDAEGRLILADALSVAAELHPDAVVDMATLTGACIAALGTRIAGLFTNDDTLGGQIRTAAKRSGERVWALPLAGEYRKHLDSDVADMKNIGVRVGGAITAALFLQEFAGDVPWAHLDIAGPSRYESDDAYVPKGPTGFGARLLVELVEQFAADRAAAAAAG
jgi:leucyl aminopeptidase